MSIDIIPLNSNLKAYSPRKVITEINENNPLLSINRIKKDSTSCTINFSGIKAANLLGKEEVDYIVFLLKNQIEVELNNSLSNNELDNNIVDNYKFRRIRNRYNRLLLNIDNSDFNVCDLDENNIKTKISDSFSEKQKDILDCITFSIETHINKGEDIRGKLIDYYEAVFNSRIANSEFTNANSEILEELNNKDGVVEKTIVLAEEIIKLEKEISNEDNFWEEFNIVKKGGTTSDKEKDELYKRYKILMDVFDIIMPFVGELNFKELQKEIDELEKVINKARKTEKLNNEEIKISKETYKGEIDKEEFLDQCNGKEGTMFFFDLIGMGLDNIKDNKKNIISFLLDGNNSKQHKENKLLEAGLKTTNKLLEIKDKLKRIAGENTKATVIGDEIYIFVEGNNDIEILKNDFTNIFSKNNKKARASYTYISEGNNNIESLEKIYARLDQATDKVNKKIEFNNVPKSPIFLGDLEEIKIIKDTFFVSFFELENINSVKNCVFKHCDLLLSNNGKQIEFN